MLRPEVIRDLKLAEHGLRMVPCDPSIQVSFPDGRVVPWWADRDRAVAEFRRHSPKDAETFVRVDDKLKKLARYLQPFFLEPPPEVDARTAAGWSDLVRVGKRFRKISSGEISELVAFLTGSLGEFLDRNYESDTIKTMFLANNVYGKHGGPTSQAAAIGFLFHLLSGGADDVQGFYGHVMGGMGSITQAIAAAGRKLGVEIRTSASVARIDTRNGRARAVILEDGTEIRAKMNLSNADPSGRSLACSENELLRNSYTRSVGIKWPDRAPRSTWLFLKSLEVQRHALDSRSARTHVLHAGSIARVCRALLRHRKVRRDSRRALGGLLSLPMPILRSHPRGPIS